MLRETIIFTRSNILSSLNPKHVQKMNKFEYKHIRLDYKGRGITQEINLLDIDGERIRGWGGTQEVPTLPEMFEALGKDGWELITHVVNQDNVANGTTFHYYNFKRLIQS